MLPRARVIIVKASLQATLQTMMVTRSLRRAMTEIRSEEYLI